jgi:endoglucanase
VQKGTAATLDFAAVTAQYARILRSLMFKQPGLATVVSKPLTSLEMALANPPVDYDQNKNNKAFKPEISTGAMDIKAIVTKWFGQPRNFATTKQRTYYDVANNLRDTMTLHMEQCSPLG